ncbi:MAG: sensor signal transduction histidine kinase [Acidobacteriaceae bacterium]|nr:sensor signal transduction histidine kinase [Acidobacteriaceae bacterium]
MVSKLGEIDMGPAGGISGSLEDNAHKHSHVVQFYGEDEFLVDELSRFIGSALVAGDGALVVATLAHRSMLEQKLKDRGLDTAKAIAKGRYVVLDASETLAKFMQGRMPDASLFTEVIGATISQITKAVGGEKPCISAFGEMVALLWAQGKTEAAISLEKLWNDLAKSHSFMLRCAYPIAGFQRDEQGAMLQNICEEHSAVIPDESYTNLATDDDRARIIVQLQHKAQALHAEIALRQSEERFRLIVDAVQDYAIFMLDAEGKVSSWNKGAQRIKGYKASEIIGSHFSRFYPEEDLLAGKPQRELEVASKEGRFEDEGWRVRRDGTKFWANVIISAIRDNGYKLIGFSKVTRDITERMQAQEELRQANKELKNEVAGRKKAEQKLAVSEKSLRQLSLYLLRTQDEERKRIGRDLHDSLGQFLAVLKMNLDSLALLPEMKESNAGQQLARCITLSEDSIKEMRTISYLLYPPMLEEMGLKSAIPWYLDGFAARSGIKTTFEVSSNFVRLRRDLELALFRVLQESLTNVHRHSGSETAEIRLTMNDETVTLEVQDNGKGIEPDILEKAGVDWVGAVGVGLRGMNERMRQLGGRVEVLPSDKGTTIKAIAPVEEFHSSSPQHDQGTELPEYA